MKKVIHCLLPDCSRPQHCRGLCKSHYTILSCLVKKKKVPSFATLVKQNKILDCRYKAPRNGVLNWLKA